MWRVYVQSHPHFGRWYARMERQPAWVVRTALLAAVLVVVVPIVVLTLAALFVGFVAFVTLGAVLVAIRLVYGLVTAPFRLWRGAGAHYSADGRVNVRVIDRHT